MGTWMGLHGKSYYAKVPTLLIPRDAFFGDRKMPSVCLTKQPLMKSSITVILHVLPQKKIPLWAHKNNFGEFQHSTSIFQEDQKTNIPTSRALFSQYLDRLTLNYCFPCATLLLKPSRPSAPSGMNKEPLWAPGVSWVWTGLWGWYTCDILPSGILNRGVNNLYWDYINLLQKQEVSDYPVLCINADRYLNMLIIMGRRRHCFMAWAHNEQAHTHHPPPPPQCQTVFTLSVGKYGNINSIFPTPPL